MLDLYLYFFVIFIFTFTSDVKFICCKLFSDVIFIFTFTFDVKFICGKLFSEINNYLLTFYLLRRTRPGECFFNIGQISFSLYLYDAVINFFDAVLSQSHPRLVLFKSAFSALCFGKLVFCLFYMWFLSLELEVIFKELTFNYIIR